MAILFTKEEAVKDLPFIEDKALYKGVDLALWLYLDKLMLEIILVTCSDAHILRYNIQEQQLYIPDDQFPSIGSGSDFVKEIINLISLRAL